MWPFSRKTKAEKVAEKQRKFAAAQYSDLLSRWQSQAVAIDKDIEQGGKALRTRARNAAKNNSYARKYLDILRTQVVGDKGVRLQCRALNRNSQPDMAANEKIELEWADFSRAYHCDFSGRMSLIEMQAMLISSLARDGEVLVRVHQKFQNAHRLAVQFLDVDLLDEQHNETLKNGNKVRMGVEQNKAGLPVAYWLTDSSSPRKKRQRVSASEILHIYRQEFANQSRGFSWMSSALLQMHHLDSFDEAAIVAARMGAANPGFFTSHLDADGGLGMDGSNSDGDLIMELSAGNMRRLPPGVDFKKFDIKYPDAMVAEFKKSCQKSLASGLNISFNALASDPESTSYATLRQFALDDRDYFRTLQRLVIDRFLEPLYITWLQLNVGRILNSDAYSKMTRIRWQPRGWSWIDPTKDAVGIEKRLAAGLTAPSIVAAEMGLDFDEVCQQAAADREVMKKYKLLTQEVQQ